MASSSVKAPGQPVLEQAVDWLLKLQSEAHSPALIHAFEQWLTSHPDHAQAWARVTQLQQTFTELPRKDLVKQVLMRMAPPSRRKALEALGVFSILLPAAWLGYRHLPLERWQAAYQTAVGEQTQLTLSDGSRLVLNTDSAVDVQYQSLRHILLYQGELWLETGHPDARPLVVTTPHGTLTPLGTRFNVKLGTTQTTLTVAEGAVRIRLPDGRASVVQAGQQQSFSDSGFSPLSSEADHAGYWQQGMLLAQEMPLGELLTELARYRQGVIRCHPALKNMKVSGAFPLRDTDAALDLLQKTLPVSIVAPSRFWIMVEPTADLAG